MYPSQIETVNSPWFCSPCICSIFPFNHIESDIEYYQCIHRPDIYSNLPRFQSSVFDCFPAMYEERPLLNNMDLDPDANYFYDNTCTSSYTTPSALETKYSSDQPHLFTVMHINCRSITSKLPEIQILLSQLPVKVLAVTETWLDQSNEGSIFIPGYRFVHACRTHGRGGGVGLFIANDIRFGIFQNPCGPQSHASYESIFVTIPQTKGHDFIIGAVYRPPALSLEAFTEEFEQLLTKLSSTKKQVLLSGDFNVDLLKTQDHLLTHNFFNCLTSHHFLPTILRPTRITEFTATLIDNIFTNAWTKLSDSSIIISDISDHLPILVSLDITPCSTNTSTTCPTRLINDATMEHFKELLSKLDWSLVSSACILNDPNLAYTLFLAEFKNAYDCAFPQILSGEKGQHFRKQPWMTGALLKSSRTKSKLYLKYLKNPNSINKSNFTAYRNKFKSLRLKAERNYYETEFNKHSLNLKKTWTIIRSILRPGLNQPEIDSLMIDGMKVDNPQIMADKFNDYFTNIGRTLADRIPKADHSFRSYLKPSPLNSFVADLTTPHEVITLTASFHTTHSSALDDIDPTIASRVIPLVAAPLSDIINSSFSTGIVPSPLKMAKVIPIYKQGNTQDITNYRPISVLPFFSKVLEKLMYQRLYNYVDKMNILYSNQHGFQSGHSTSMALLDMQDKIADAIDDNKFSLGIFLDLAKAFDTVDHSILLAKLENYGIRGVPLEWFKSYLDQRRQCVYCRGCLSNNTIIKYGVPQGSILGPLLFLLYINDLPDSSALLHFILFADDTNIFFSHKSIDSLLSIVNAELIHVAEWFKANKLSLNLGKTNYVLFRSRRKSVPPTDHILSIDSIPIAQVYSSKFLGVYIDQHLTWKDHINNISTKVAKNIGILSRVSYLLPAKVKLSLYYSLVYPYLIYCNIAWASNYPSRLNRLSILQRRVVRIIAGRSLIVNTAEGYSSLRILTIPQINKLLICEFVYRFINNTLPSTFSSYFSNISDIHSHYTRSSNCLSRSYARTNTRYFTIRCAGPPAWNKLPKPIRNLPSLPLFKKKIRALLLDCSKCVA